MKRVKPYSKTNRDYPYLLQGNTKEKKCERIKLVVRLFSNDTYIKSNGEANITAMAQKLSVSRQTVKADLRILNTAFNDEYIKEDGKPNVSKVSEALGIPTHIIKRYIEAVIYNQSHTLNQAKKSTNPTLKEKE